jgi:hemerythrin HHE cation binding domain-containing protein
MTVASKPFTPVPGRVRRRSQELASLSRDHHHALAQAMRLKRAQESDAATIWSEFLVAWEAEGSAHFAEEETVLLPAYASVVDPSDRAVVRTLVEHVLIRAKISEIRSQATPSVADLHLLGSWLELHVRLEERVLFPAIEDAMPDERLSRLANALQD